MTKYSCEFKVKVVSKYLKDSAGYKDLCKEYRIPSISALTHWVQQAKSQGIESLKVKHTKVQYSQTFKMIVIEYVHTHQISRALTTAHFGISASQVNLLENKEWLEFANVAIRFKRIA